MLGNAFTSTSGTSLTPSSRLQMGFGRRSSGHGVYRQSSASAGPGARVCMRACVRVRADAYARVRVCVCVQGRQKVIGCGSPSHFEA